jgi:hypothetical protein
MGALSRQTHGQNMKRPDLRLQRRPGLTEAQSWSIAHGLFKKYTDGVHPSNGGSRT